MSLNVGIDIGATSIKLGLISRDGKVRHHVQSQIEDSKKSADAIFRLIQQSVELLLQEVSIEFTVVICTTLDPDHDNSPILRWMKSMPSASDVQDQYKMVSFYRRPIFPNGTMSRSLVGAVRHFSAR